MFHIAISADPIADLFAVVSFLLALYVAITAEKKSSVKPDGTS